MKKSQKSSLFRRVFMITAYDNKVEINSEDPKRRYHEVIDLPPEADIDVVKSTFTNGLLEITFNKKPKSKLKGKSIKVY